MVGGKRPSLHRGDIKFVYLLSILHYGRTWCWVGMRLGMRKKKPKTEEIELDLGRYELRRGEGAAQLAKKPMELLIFLVSRRDQLVTREEIVSKLWRSDLFVDTESNVNNLIRKIRAALGDDSDQPRFVETVVGKGYRFIGPVRVLHARQEFSGFSRSLQAEPGAVRGGRASLAVLPLTIVGNSADDRGLGLGFADALIARLGNLQDVNVLPTSAVLAEPVDEDPTQAATRLGARFLVRGAMQSTKNQWRLSVHMFDAHLQRVCFERRCDLDLNRLFEMQEDIAREIAGALNRQIGAASAQSQGRYSKDPMAYAEFMHGYRLSTAGDSSQLEEATRRLENAVLRDPSFALAHATLSVAYASRHFESDPARTWLEKAELHCQRALELDANLAEAHVAKAFLLWGPSKNFQHLDAIEELRRALELRKNLPHAYNRLGTILVHIGFLDLARDMYEQGRAYHPQKAISHSVVQVYMWSGQYELAEEQIRLWRSESPGNKYPVYFAPQPAMMKGNWKKAKVLLDEALEMVADEPMIVSLQGLFFAMQGKKQAALKCLAEACASPKSFGHAHHTFYQIACILSLLERRQTAFEWLERSVSTGFACWPFFLKDPCLRNLRELPEFEVLVSSLQRKYPDNLGLQ
jgi:DNA-binding winged helix-turn-helix (wHTH) protein/tetratricopeptide (TPR) repeat protein